MNGFWYECIDLLVVESFVIFHYIRRWRQCRIAELAFCFFGMTFMNGGVLRGMFGLSISWHITVYMIVGQFYIPETHLYSGVWNAVSRPSRREFKSSPVVNNSRYTERMEALA